MSLKKKNLTNELLRNYDNSRAKCVNFFLQKSSTAKTEHF